MSTTPLDAASIARELAEAGTGAASSGQADLMARVDALFAAHQDVVYATCLRFTHQPELAIELAQDTFLLAYQRLATFRGDARFGTWLVAIARFHCLNALRRRHDFLTEDGVLEATDPARTVLDKLRRIEREELLREAAAAVLDDDERVAVHLRYTEHVSLPRIEEHLGLTAKSGARGLLQRSKRKLGRALRQRLVELGHGSSLFRESTSG